MKEMRTFVWCTYRDWSFQVLEALLDLKDWRCGLVITTLDCRYDFSVIEAAGIAIMRIDPRTGLKAGADGFVVDAHAGVSCVGHSGPHSRRTFQNRAKSHGITPVMSLR